MMNSIGCQKCESKRVMSLYGKCSDMSNFSMQEFDHEHDGYAPHIPNVCGGDNIQFDVCLDCGQIQGEWPLEKTKFEGECEEGDAEKEDRMQEYERSKDFNQGRIF